MGDFNCALNCDVDRSSKKSNNNDKCAEIVNQYMEDTIIHERTGIPRTKSILFALKNLHLLAVILTTY